MAALKLDLSLLQERLSPGGGCGGGGGYGMHTARPTCMTPGTPRGRAPTVWWDLSPGAGPQSGGPQQRGTPEGRPSTAKKSHSVGACPLSTGRPPEQWLEAWLRAEDPRRQRQPSPPRPTAAAVVSAAGAAAGAAADIVATSAGRVSAGVIGGEAPDTLVSMLRCDSTVSLSSDEGQICARLRRTLQIGEVEVEAANF